MTQSRERGPAGEGGKIGGVVPPGEMLWIYHGSMFQRPAGQRDKWDDLPITEKVRWACVEEGLLKALAEDRPASQAAPVAGVEDTVLLDMIEKHKLAVGPQCNGGWVVEGSIEGIDDAQEYDLARTRKGLRSALRMAASELEDLFPAAPPPPGNAERLDLVEAAWNLLLACEDDMETHDPADRDDEPVGASTDAPTRVQFGHMRRLRKALLASRPDGMGGGDQTGAPATPSGSQASPEAPSDLRPLGIDPSRWELSEDTRAYIKEVDHATIRPGDPRLNDPALIGPTGLAIGLTHPRTGIEDLCIRNPAPNAVAPAVTNARTVTVRRDTERFSNLSEDGRPAMPEGYTADLINPLIRSAAPCDGSGEAGETHSGSTEGDSAVPEGQAPEPDPVGEAKALLDHGWRTMDDCPSDGRPVWVSGGTFDVAILKEADGDWWRSATAAGLGRPTHWHPEIKPPALAIRSSQAGEVRDDG